MVTQSSSIRIVLFLVSSLGLSHCGENHTFSSTEVLVNENAGPIGTKGGMVDEHEQNQNDQKAQRASLNLQIISQRNLEDQQPVELMFIVDTSESVAEDDIEKVKAAVPRLVNGLNNEKVPFVTRFVPMKTYLNQLTERDEFYVPLGMGSGAANYDRSAVGSPYLAVKRFTNTTDVSTIENELSLLAANPQLSSNEPGLCATLDYPLWLNNSPQAIADSKFGSNRIHAVVITDEDDRTGPGQGNRGFQTHNLYTGQVESSKPLYCRRQLIETQECKTERFDRLLTFQKYTYEYKKVRRSTVYQHTVRFWSRNKCDIMFGNNPSERTNPPSYPLVKLYSKSQYVTNLYNCEQLEEKFSCSADSYTTTSTSDKTGSKRCQLYRGDCAQPVTNYECAAAPNYSKTFSSNPGNTILNCPVAAEFECTLYPDGQPRIERKSREQALALMADFGASCVAIRQAGKDTWAETRASAHATLLDRFDPGVFQNECNSLSCTAKTSNTNVVKTWEASNTHVGAGGTCAPRVNDFAWKDQASSFDESLWGVGACHDYTCTDASEYIPVRNVVESNKSKYLNCQNINSNHSPRNAYKVTESGAFKRLTGVPLVSNTWAGYRLIADGNEHAISSTEYCQANLAEVALPAAVYSKPANKNVSNSWQTITITRDHRMSRSEIVNYLRTQYNDPEIQDSDLWIDSLIINDTVAAEETDHREIYTYQRYPKDDPLWTTAVDMKESYISYVDAVDDGVIEIPPVENRNAANPVVVKEYLNKEGLLTRQNCSEPKLTLEEIAPEPDQVLKAFRNEFSQNQFVQHAIVMTNPTCEGNANAGSELGSKYQKLAELTGGHVGDICTPDYSPIIDKIVANIVDEIVTVYPLPEKYRNRVPYSVKNKTTKAELKEGRDWWVNSESIVFNKKAVNVDDEIMVEY